MAARLRAYRLPFAQPMVTAQVRVAFREGQILELTDQQGCHGFGEVAPWPGFGSGPAAVATALPDLVARPDLWLDLSLGSADDVAAWVAGQGWLPEIAAAAELALLDLLSQSARLSLSAYLGEWLGGRPRSSITVAAGVSDPEQARQAKARGVSAMKIKVGACTLADDLARVAAIRSAVGPAVQLRIDANAGWDLQTALAAAGSLAAQKPAWIEQPLAADDLLGLRAVSEQVALPIALDESITAGTSPEDLLATGARIWVLKPSLLGGLLPSLKLARTAAAAQVQLVASHAWESAVGRTAALHLAALLPGTTCAAGLGSPLAQDLAAVDNLPQRTVPTTPGLGLRPNLVAEQGHVVAQEAQL